MGHPRVSVLGGWLGASRFGMGCGNTDSTSAITKALAALLKALATGDLAGAKSDLTKLQADLNKNESSAATDGISGGSSPLDQLVTKLADALKSGGMADALQDVASYLVTTALSSGTLLNVTV